VKKKISLMQVFRILSQLAFLFILPALVGLVFNQIKTLYVNIVDGTFTVSNSLSNFGIIIVVIPLTIILGRFFCGWICAFGTLNDFIYILSQKVFKTKIKVDEKVDNILKFIKYFILVFIVVVIWTIGSTAFDGMSPWTAFANILDIKNSLLENIIGFILLTVIIIGAFFIERFFCRYLCPLGAIFAILSRFRIFNIKKTREKCGPCRICTNNCTMGIRLYKTDKVTSGECINCFKCIDVCPRSNTKANIVGTNVDSRLAGAVAITAFTGVYSATTAIGGQTTNSLVQSNVESKSSNSTSQSTAIYKDGTYTGTANGYKPGLTVSVTVSGGKISDIQITSHHESKGFYERPFQTVPQEIIEEQSTDVDAVSGATRTSKGIMTAVDNALKNAKIETGSISDSDSQDTSSNQSSASSTTESKSEEAPTQDQGTKAENRNNNKSRNKKQEDTTENEATTNNTNEATTVYKDGTYTGTARGYKPGLTVSVTVSGGKIVDIKITSHNESRGFYEVPFQVVPQEIIEEQSTSVDAVSGATRSSKGIMNAVANALQNAKQ